MKIRTFLTLFPLVKSTTPGGVMCTDYKFPYTLSSPTGDVKLQCVTHDPTNDYFFLFSSSIGKIDGSGVYPQPRQHLTILDNSYQEVKLSVANAQSYANDANTLNCAFTETLGTSYVLWSMKDDSPLVQNVYTYVF